MKALLSIPWLNKVKNKFKGFQKWSQYTQVKTIDITFKHAGSVKKSLLSSIKTQLYIIDHSLYSDDEYWNKKISEITTTPLVKRFFSLSLEKLEKWLNPLYYQASVHDDDDVL